MEMPRCAAAQNCGVSGFSGIYRIRLGPGGTALSRAHLEVK